MVKFGSSIKCLACSAALLLLCAGCGGFAATPSFSPLMFFLPGLVDAKNTNAAPRSVTAVQPQDPKTELALAK
jgi:hypothetical protein